jgi:hypothetical protein
MTAIAFKTAAEVPEGSKLHSAMTYPAQIWKKRTGTKPPRFSCRHRDNYQELKHLGAR